MSSAETSYYEGSLKLEDKWLNGLEPDPYLLVSDWADRYRILSAKSASESGPWRTSRTPYLKEPMDCLSPSSPVKRVVWMKGNNENSD